MKKSKVIFLALLACAFGASARTVDDDEAALVARGWNLQNSPAFRSLGAVQSVTAELDASSNVLWYVVKMAQGAAVVASDTEIEPVIAVMPGSDGVIPEKHPLRAMLKRDLPQRLRQVKSMKLATSAQSKMASKWARLKLRGSGMRMLNAQGNPAVIVRWLDGWNSPNTEGTKQTLRFWNQQDSSDYFTNARIFDKDTPHNYACGCVATAGASIMHYFRAPTGNQITRWCYTDYWYGEQEQLTTVGGTYDWSLIDGLNLKRGTTITLSDDALNLLARVASDCGIGCSMAYNANGQGASGSNTYNLMQSFRDVFNVQNAQLVTKDGGNYGGGEDEDIGNYPKLIYNQIRGGAPIAMGIDGHEVVACGYGIDSDSTDYTYVFLGWGGSNDAWYALPKIDTKATVEGGWYTSTFIDEIITEIAFDDNYVAVVGQVVDLDGSPVAGDMVTLGNGEVVTTDENGYWGVRVSPDDPAFVTDSLGKRHEYVVGTQARETTRGGKASSALAADLPEALLITLNDPSIEVYDGEMYQKGVCSLDAALNVASTLVDPRVRLLKECMLYGSVVLTNSVTIFATNENAAASAVTCRNGAMITVADGATVTMTNVVFDVVGATKTVVVEDGGVLKIGGECGLGAVETADADNLVVVSALTRALYVDCAGAVKKSDVFAKGDLNFTVAKDCAHRMMHYENSRFGGEAVEIGGSVKFRWSQGVPVPRSEAVGQLNGEYYRSLADIFEDLVQNTNTEIVIFKDAAFTNYVSLVTNLTIRGEGDARPVLTAAGSSGFCLRDGGSLTVSNLVFTGYSDDDLSDYYGFIGIDGGELKLENGAVLDDMIGYVNNGSGVIDLDRGAMTMEAGAAIVNCRAKGGEGIGRGGAVCVWGSDCELNLQGGMISNCYASSFGGGVYVSDNGGKSGTVNVSGDLTVKNNWSDDYPKDDICLNTTRIISNFRLAGPLSGTNAVGVWISTPVDDEVFDESGINAEGKAFATNAVGIVGSTSAFFNDTDDTLTAVVGDGGMLVWAKSVDDGQCEEKCASAHVHCLDDTVRHYTNLVTAIAHMATGTTARIEMRRGEKGIPNTRLNKYDTILTPITLPADCHLTLTAGESGYRVRRYRSVDITIPSGTSLTVTNLVMYCHQSNPGSVTNAFLAVDGGSLTLGEGACISNIIGNASHDAAAVFVKKGGVVTMESGSRIYGCQNTNNYDMVFESGVNYGCGGGVLLNNATAHLKGGEIAECLATRGGGVYACGGSAVYVSGDMRIAGNQWLNTDGVRRTGNVYVAEGSELFLDGPLTGMVGKGAEYYVGGAGDTNLVAEVRYDWAEDLDALTNSAARFVHDVTGEAGVAVTNDTDALIVWCGAVKGGVYTNAFDGAGYWLAGKMPNAGSETGLLPPLTSDSEVAAELAKLDDKMVSAKITTLEEYNDFVTWANGVEGGKAAVAASDKAYVSYQFGTTALFEEEPTVELTDIVNAGDGLSVSVVVKDGEDPVAVASAKVKEMFEATSDMNDWSGKKLGLTVKDAVQNDDKSVTFAVTPTADSPAVFIRLTY